MLDRFQRRSSNVIVCMFGVADPEQSVQFLWHLSAKIRISKATLRPENYLKWITCPYINTSRLVSSEVFSLWVFVRRLPRRSRTLLSSCDFIWQIRHRLTFFFSLIGIFCLLAAKSGVCARVVNVTRVKHIYLSNKGDILIVLFDWVGRNGSSRASNFLLDSV